jgi:hypothetical protein
MSQDEEAARVPPRKEIEEEPAVAVTVPPQLLLTPFGVATIRPACRLSVNEMPVKSLAFGFLMLKSTENVPFWATAS